MSHPRALLLVALCALASACASTGQQQADAAPAVTTVVDGTASDTIASDDAATDSAPASTAPAAATATVADDAAETDFDAIYGAPGTTANAPGGGAFDPWEAYNRRVHAFNNAVDRNLAKPLAQAYTDIVPRPLRIGINNFFDNLGQPVSVVNSVLQGNPRGAANALGRFLLNSTLGIGGLIDVATKAKMPDRDEDFGQTLAVWGWQRSRYLEVPFLGPRTVRDLLGLAADTPLRPIQYVEDDKTRLLLQGLQAVDLRAKLLSIEGFSEGAVDEYSLFRDIWLQRRNYQIHQAGRRQRNAAPTSDLPPYLQDEDAPATPTP